MENFLIMTDFYLEISLNLHSYSIFLILSEKKPSQLWAKSVSKKTALRVHNEALHHLVYLA